MSERQGIEIDYCPQCRGVWLDRGELDKIIERSDAATAAPPRASAPPPPPQPEYRERGYDDRHYGKPYKKNYKKSFLRTEEHTSELQSLMRNSYAVFCLKKKKK